jgi:hypothetical protein
MRLFILLFVMMSFASCNKILETSIHSNAERQQKGHSVVKEKEDDGFVCRYPVDRDIINMDEWVKYLQDNLVLDSASLDTIPPGKYTVMIVFVVNTNWQLSEVTIEKDPGYGLGKRTRDVIMLCENPSAHSCRVMEAYKIYRKQLVTFVIEDDEMPCEESNGPAL